MCVREGGEGGIPSWQRKRREKYQQQIGVVWVSDVSKVKRAEKDQQQIGVVWVSGVVKVKRTQKDQQPIWLV
jgi:hypothetical protein